MANKTPTRTCVACGKSGDKRSFVRIVRTPDGSIELDLTGRVAGRGAYLCKESSCFEKAAQKRLLDAKLRCKVSADEYRRLETEFAQVCPDAGVRSRDGE